MTPRRPWHAVRERPRLALTLLAALAFALALWRPGMSWPTRVGSTMLVVDITQSMNVADMRWQGAPVTRIAYVRALLRRVARELPCGYRLGIGVFAERTSLMLMAPVEVCEHYAALDNAIDALDWRMAWAADSHLYYGVHSALDVTGRRWPGSSLAFFSDGHQAPVLFPGREPRYERSAATPVGVLFGVGGSVALPIPHTDTDGKVTGYWTPDEVAVFASTGGPTLSALDMERMQAGEDLRNRAQRPAGFDAEYLSARHDDVLAAVARSTGLSVHVAGDDPRAVVDALKSLPGGRILPHRVELHDALVVAGALALLASLLPLPRLRVTALFPTMKPKP